MNAADSLLEAQTLALLRRLAREQETRCQRLRDEAATQAAAITRSARAEARARVRAAVVTERRLQQDALARRRAALETAARQRAQAALGEWLASAWQALPLALEQRWQQGEARALWCAAALQAAQRDLLQAAALQIEVEPRWLAALAPLVEAASAAGARVTLAPQPGLGAGLRIRAGHACVDATIDGLLAPRGRIAAELLAELERQLATRTVPP